MVLKDKDGMIKSDIRKAINGGICSFKTVFDYLNYMKSKDIVSFKKSGRICEVCLTDKGKTLVKPIQTMRTALK